VSESCLTPRCSRRRLVAETAAAERDRYLDFRSAGGRDCIVYSESEAMSR